jgi:Family of unknown function (DUF6263)
VTADGTATLQHVVESVTFDMDSPMGRTTFDSTKPDSTGGNAEAALLASMLSSMVEEPLTLVMSPTGALQKIEGFDRMMTKMLAKLPQNRAGAATLNMMKGFVNEDAMRNMFSQGYSQLPDRQVKIGETWNTEVTIKNPMLGAMKVTTVATLKALEEAGSNQVARIATEVTMAMDPSTTPSSPTPMGLTMKMTDSTGDGEIVFDTGRGRLVRAITRTTMPLTMTGAAPDGTALTMTSTVKSTTTVEIVEK